QELDDLFELLFGFIHAGDVRKAHLHVVFGEDAVLAAGERHDPAFRAAHAPEEKAPDAEQQHERNDPAKYLRQPPADHLARVLHAGGVELLDTFCILDARRAVRTAAVGVAFVCSADRLFADEYFRNLAGADGLLELAVGNLTPRRRHEPRLCERQQKEEAEDVPHRPARPAGRERAPIAGTPVPWIHPRRNSWVCHLRNSFGAGLLKRQLIVADVDYDAITFVEVPLEHAHGQRIEDAALNSPLQRPRAIHRIVTLADDEALGGLGQFYVDFPI